MKRNGGGDPPELTSIKLTDSILFQPFLDLFEKYKGLSNIKVKKENQKFLDSIIDQRIATTRDSLLEDNLVPPSLNMALKF